MTQIQTVGDQKFDVATVEGRKAFIKATTQAARKAAEALVKEATPKSERQVVIRVNSGKGVFIGGTIVMNAFATQLLYVLEHPENVLQFLIDHVGELSWTSKSGSEEDARNNQLKAVELLTQYQTIRELMESDDKKSGGESGGETEGEPEAEATPGS